MDDPATLDLLASVAVCLMLIAAIAAWRLSESPARISTTLDGAKQALADAVEWAKWMSGVQTATLAGLAWLLAPEGGGSIDGPTGYPLRFAIGAFMFNGAGLFCCAWVLSAASSISLRVHGFEPAGGRSERFDVHETPIFAAETIFGFKSPRFGNVMAAQHLFWSCGLISFALFVLASLNRAG